MMDFKDQVIATQAKTIEGMRQRLKKFKSLMEERQTQIQRMENMIVMRDLRISTLDKNWHHAYQELKKALKDNPDSYQSELTRKMQENENLKKDLDFLRNRVRSLRNRIFALSYGG